MQRIILLSIFSLISISTLFPKILHVPDEYPTIQSAIDASENSDTVLVSEGIYYENINYIGKKLVVASNYMLNKDWQFILNTIIDGSQPVNPDSGSVVTITSGEDSTAVLEGFTLRNGTGTIALQGKWIEGGGVLIEGSSPVIKNNIIIDNETVFRKSASNGGGGGISSIRGCPTIVNNMIISNKAGYAGGIVLNWSGGIVRNNIIYNNFTTSQYGSGGLMVWDSPSKPPQIVENNTIVGNYSLSITGGMSIDLNANPISKNNIIWTNRQATGKQVVNPQRGSYNNIEDYSDADNISFNPLLLEKSFLLQDGSPCIDAGDPSQTYNDILDLSAEDKALFPSKGNLRNDMGAFGGSLASVLPQLEIYNLYFRNKVFIMGKTGIEGSTKIEILNLSTTMIKIDSISNINKSICSIAGNLSDKELYAFSGDTIYVTYNVPASGNYVDTVIIYHQLTGIENPSRIALSFNITNPVGVEDSKTNPNEFKLYQNYPNPFNPTTNFEFQISDFGFVTLKIYDVLGNEVSTLISENLQPGNYKYIWDAGKFASGVYLAKLVSGNLIDTKKILYQK